MKPNFGALGYFIKKGASKIASKKGPRPDTNRTLFPCQEALGQAATIKNCSNKKQLFGHKLKQLFELLFENVDWAEN